MTRIAVQVVLYGVLFSIGSVVFLESARAAQQETPELQEPITFLETPSSLHSAEPNLNTSPEGDVYLTWISKAGTNRASLHMARLEGQHWSAPIKIASGSNWFVNWADFPTLSPGADGHMAANFLVKSGASTYAYDVHLTTSTDAGKTWNSSFTPHSDGTQTEHGFVSLLPWHGDRFFATWLDGRNTGSSGHGDHRGAMTLRAAFFDPSGALYEEALLDDKTCECCQTSAVKVNGQVIVAYRNRSDEEVRDIAVVRYKDGAWTKPSIVHDDNWEIAGCPVNGPSLAASGNTIGVGWFTAAGETPKIQAAVSNNLATSFSSPIQIDEGAPLGRIDLVSIDDGRMLVSWVEKTDTGAAIKVRLLTTANNAPVVGPALTITQTSPSRRSGFPHMARTNGGVVLAWTEVAADNATTVRTAILSDKQIEELKP